MRSSVVYFAAAFGLIDSNGGILFGARGVLTAHSERFIESMQEAACGLGD